MSLFNKTYVGEIYLCCILIFISALYVFRIYYEKSIEPLQSQQLLAAASTTAPVGTGTCYQLSDYINIESGLSVMPIYYYTDLLNQIENVPLIQKDGVSTTLAASQILLPDAKSAANPPKTDLYSFIKKHGCQVIPYRFYLNDTGLSDYERMFNENHGGIVPVSMMIRYTGK